MSPSPVAASGSTGEVGRYPADENGVLVMKPHEIANRSERAVGMQNAEQATARPAKGERLPDINDTNKRIAETVAQQK